MVRCEQGWKIFDVGPIQGTEAHFSARHEKSRVVGMALFPLESLKARSGNVSNSMGNFNQFLADDSGGLPFAPDTFDVVVSDYAFSTLLNKAWFAREISRVLKPYGWLAMLDVFLRHPLSNESQENLGSECFCCGAKTLEEYRYLFNVAGLDLIEFEDHTPSFRSAVYQVATKCRSLNTSWQPVAWSGNDGCEDKNKPVQSRVQWRRIFQKEEPGYGLWIFKKRGCAEPKVSLKEILQEIFGQ